MKNTPGHSHKIWVSAEDEMTCIDILKSSGYPTHGWSLAQVISQALKASCRFVRDNNINEVQPRDGFQYEEMTRPFIISKHKGKLEATKNMALGEIARMSVDAPASVVKLEKPTGELPDDIVEKLILCEEVLAKLDDKLDAGIASDADATKARQMRGIIKRLRNGEDVDVILNA